MHVDARDRVIEFVEKPKDPPGIPDRPDYALASMGIYVFETRFLMEQLRRDAATEGSSRDFGKDIIPVPGQERHGVGAPFPRSCVRSLEGEGLLLARRGHGRRLLEGQYRSLPTSPRSSTSTTSDWPIWTYAEITPPAKFVHDYRRPARLGDQSSLVSGDCIVSGG